MSTNEEYPNDCYYGLTDVVTIKRKSDLDRVPLSYLIALVTQTT
ncbi:MAG: hypothetical protein QXP36_09200 [Conexivisphaerales archaeon]